MKLRVSAPASKLNLGLSFIMVVMRARRASAASVTLIVGL